MNLFDICHLILFIPMLLCIDKNYLFRCSGMLVSPKFECKTPVFPLKKLKSSINFCPIIAAKNEYTACFHTECRTYRSTLALMQCGHRTI